MDLLTLTQGPSSAQEATEGWAHWAPTLPRGQGRDGSRKGTQSHLIWLQNRLTLNPQSPFHSLRQAHFHGDGHSHSLSTSPLPAQSQLLPASCFMPTVTRVQLLVPHYY